MATKLKKRRTRTKQAALKFDQRLVLCRWMLEQFEVEFFDDLAKDLKDPDQEGFTEDNQTRFLLTLQYRLWERQELSNDLLRQYDANIVRHWKSITEKRNQKNQKLYPKYFQYLCLLFTEVYLDRYFSNPHNLLNDLNRHVEQFNQLPEVGKADQITTYTLPDLRKLAFWSATGSGKTLLMHINILQFMHYLKKSGRIRELNRIILLTPNEGLSIQHLDEFEKSDIDARLFVKEDQVLFKTQDLEVEIIDIHK
ncbi:MAG: DEAD/DEAH box helicase family protein, partial [Candidatus Hinthialibacter sp.]